MEDGVAAFIVCCRKSLFRVERVYDGGRNCVVHRLAPEGCPMTASLPSLVAALTPLVLLRPGDAPPCSGVDAELETGLAIEVRTND